jgi:hypothetical protein
MYACINTYIHKWVYGYDVHFVARIGPVLDSVGAIYLFECPIGRPVWSTITFDNCDVDVRLHCRCLTDAGTADAIVRPTRHTKSAIICHFEEVC